MGGTPIAGWFVMENPQKSGSLRATPILGPPLKCLTQHINNTTSFATISSRMCTDQQTNQSKISHDALKNRSKCIEPRVWVKLSVSLSWAIVFCHT